MKIADVSRLIQKLDEYDIPLKNQLALQISRDDASELLIDLIEKREWVEPIGDLNNNFNAIKAERYLNSGLAYRLLDGGTLFGMKLIAK